MSSCCSHGPMIESYRSHIKVKMNEQIRATGYREKTKQKKEPK